MCYINNVNEKRKAAKMILKTNKHYNLEKSFNLIYKKDFFYICDTLGGIIYIYNNLNEANKKYIDLSK